MSGTLVLDVSRLLSGAGRSTPTGIDRVEHAYARHLLDTEGDRLRFAALDARGRIAILPRGAATRFIQRTERVWAAGSDRTDPELRLEGLALAAAALVGDGGRSLRPRPGHARASYLLLSHHHLDRPEAVRRFVEASGARLVTLVHDLIPIAWPEYNRPGHAARHALRMTTAAEQSEVVIVNSAGTAAAFAPFLAAAARKPPLVVAPLGVTLQAPAPPSDQEGAGGFVCISTLEPRKNHLLLFNVWRRLVSELGAGAPRLHVVGARGWHNEAAVDVLDRSSALAPHLTEHGALGDVEMARLLAGARAVLMPSFAEGYGLPVVEALAAGAPVICSDLPTLREIGGDAPDYLDPIDGPAWLRAVKDYAAPGSPRRSAQLARIARWARPTWEAHFAVVEPYLRAEGEA